MINEPRKIGVVDDHTLFRKGMVELINRFKDFVITGEFSNGKELMQYITAGNIPDIIMLDINMPVMDGYDTASWLRSHHPNVKVLALSMYDTDESIIKILKCGAHGFLLKDAHPAELESALTEVLRNGFYHSEIAAHALMGNIHKRDQHQVPELSVRELEFLKLACSELTYKEIAVQMKVSARTVDGYREALFEKLNTKNRVGLAMFAVRSRLVKIN